MCVIQKRIAEFIIKFNRTLRWSSETYLHSDRNLLPASVIPELYYFIWYLDGIAVQKVDVHMCVVVLVHILGICFNTIWIFLEIF